MIYLLQAADYFELLVYLTGACVGFWAFRRSRKCGYLLVASYFCVAACWPWVRAEINRRRSVSVPVARQQKIDAAVQEAYERVMREEGMQPVPASRDVRLPLGPLLLGSGVWLLARKEVDYEAGR